MPNEVDVTEKADENRPITVALVLVDFPAKRITAFKYFLLLLNRLQRTFEFSFYDPPKAHPLNALLTSTKIVDPDKARECLLSFADELKSEAEAKIADYDLVQGFPTQVIVISQATFTNYHYLIRRKHVTLLALGEWERSMAPPSVAEFLQLSVLRAAYSATELGPWETIHLGTRSCVFDFTRNLQDTRMMTLVGLGVCDECRRALAKDGFTRSADEIRYVAEKAWLGKRTEPGTPANMMARFGYDLYVTRGFTPTFSEWLQQILQEDAAKECIKLLFLVLGTAFLVWAGLKKE